METSEEDQDFSTTVQDEGEEAVETSDNENPDNSSVPEENGPRDSTHDEEEEEEEEEKDATEGKSRRRRTRRRKKRKKTGHEDDSSQEEEQPKRSSKKRTRSKSSTTKTTKRVKPSNQSKIPKSFRELPSDRTFLEARTKEDAPRYPHLNLKISYNDMNLESTDKLVYIRLPPSITNRLTQEVWSSAWASERESVLNKRIAQAYTGKSVVHSKQLEELQNSHLKSNSLRSMKLPGSNKIITNTFITEWEDGSKTVNVGSECLKVVQEKESCSLYENLNSRISGTDETEIICYGEEDEEIKESGIDVLVPRANVYERWFTRAPLSAIDMNKEKLKNMLIGNNRKTTLLPFKSMSEANSVQTKQIIYKPKPKQKSSTVLSASYLDDSDS